MPAGKSNLYLLRMSCTRGLLIIEGMVIQLNTDQDMVARDVTFVCADLDGKHDCYGVVANISLKWELYRLLNRMGSTCAPSIPLTTGTGALLIG
jgi:hypothetical protein